jgi:hypothetical protein
LDFFLNLETSRGDLVRNIRLREGHYLVYKIPMADNPFIALPDQYKAKAVKNIVSIKGFVIVASEPWRRKTAKQYWVWDKDQEMEMPKYKTITSPTAVPSEVVAGKCVLYNSYNIAKIVVPALDDELVIIRECDMMAIWDPKEDKSVTLGNHTMSQNSFTHYPGIDGAGAV